MSVKSQLQQYSAAIAMALIPFLFFSFYIFNRRGIYDLYVFNRVAGDTAIVIIGFILLIGPLCGVSQRFSKFIQYRKELGIVAGILALTHFIFSVFVLIERFPLSRYLSNPLSPLFGLIAIVILIYLLAISYAKIQSRLSPKFWWKSQQWGVRFAFTTAIIHLFFRKYEAWFNWFSGRERPEVIIPSFPPEDMIVFIFVAAVFLIRFSLLFLPKTASRSVVGGFGILMVMAYAFCFIWGIKAFNLIS